MAQEPLFRLLQSAAANARGKAMLVIEWLGRLPQTDGIVILGQEATDYVTAVEAKSRALLLWPTMRTARTGSPDGFQIVDQDDVCARLILFQEIA